MGRRRRRMTLPKDHFRPTEVWNETGREGFAERAFIPSPPDVQATALLQQRVRFRHFAPKTD